MRNPHDLMHSPWAATGGQNRGLAHHKPQGTSAMIRLLSVNTARVDNRLIQGRAVATGIGKQPVSGPVAVGTLGLEGDEQADLSRHGGQSKAVYAYPVLHYPFWQTVRAQAQVAAPGAALPYGAMGENLTLDGLDEAALWIGDRLRLPGCELVVSEPRNPCFKFDAVMGFAQASSLMNQSGYCGAYLAVLHPGTLQAGDQIELIPGPREVNLRELFMARTRRRR
jgi:MOSC domain-containing protein YiiM